MTRNAPQITVALGIGLLLLADAPTALAQGANPNQAVDYAQLLPAALTLLFPIGLLLLISSAMPEDKAPCAAINLLVVWGVAALAYFALGFAFNFGGIAQVSPQPEMAGLYWEWYPLDQSVDVEVARLWGVIALQGWGLSGVAANQSVLLLFLSHVSLVGVAAMIPAGALLQRGQGAAAVLTGLLVGAFVYPVAANWLWGGGWLSNVGATLKLGHGLVDFGGAGPIFLVGSGVALAGLFVFRPAEDAPDPEIDPSPNPKNPLAGSVPMPSAYLPIFSVLGGGLMLLAWFGLSTGVHNPTAVDFLPVQAALAGLLAALAAALAAAAYSWFTTQEFNPLMASRGLAAGLILVMAGAPFIPIWLLLVAGLVMGLLAPLSLYLFDQKLRLRDSLGILTTFGLSAVISLLLVGLFAGGQRGQAWNRIGATGYLGVEGQGISGLVAAPGFAPDWPGQLQAQLLGIGVFLLWGLLLGFIVYHLYAVALRAWARTQTGPVEVAPAGEIIDETDDALP